MFHSKSHLVVLYSQSNFLDVLFYLWDLFTPKSLHNATNVVVKLLGKEMWTKQK